MGLAQFETMRYGSASGKANCTQSPSSAPPAVKPTAPSPSLSIIPSERYLEIIELLKKQIEENKKQIKKTQEINHSITGNRIQKPTIGEKATESTAAQGQRTNQKFFLHDPHLIFIYPAREEPSQKISNPQLVSLFRKINSEEKRILGRIALDLRAEFNKRLKYNSIIAKATSLKTLQDAEKRFTYIVNLLNNINKTKDLREASELQVRIKNMLAMLQNESAKLEMVRSLNDNEMIFSDIQKQTVYKRFYNSEYTKMPTIY
ncbi:type IV secretion system protein [Bartonella sp. MM73XJBT.G]|uniref:type IV secretion system protein n=1 Tax=Bartonella sp. MM73XJBT.G TaxID=3019097 RepID=UPI0023624C08|nr:type IV secretion system protein [Bartonella sp. MM73XJBT.G]